MRTFLITLTFFTTIYLTAQEITEVTGIRLYEHHNVENGGFGEKSGYDFLTNEHFPIWSDTQQQTPHTPEDKMRLDMHELYTTRGNQVLAAGFTSAEDGALGGNGDTMYTKVDASFDYDGITMASQIAAAYDIATATLEQTNIAVGDVFVAKVRNSDRYVAIKITDVQIEEALFGNVYFDFDYKYGETTLSTAGFENQKTRTTLYPNPAEDVLTIVNKTANSQLKEIEVIDINGRVVQTFDAFQNNVLDITTSELAPGAYYIRIILENSVIKMHKFVKK